MGFLWAILQTRCDGVGGYRIRHGGGMKMMNGFEVIDLYRPGADAERRSIMYPIGSIP